MSLSSWKAECLEDYVRERMTPRQFADYVGISITGAYEILQGNRWIQIPRPEGFEYPWPERRNLGSRGSFQRRQAEYIAAITDMRTHNLSKQEVAERLGVVPQTVDSIIKLLIKKSLIKA
jgi:hypothetical protein